ncbi:MAG: hypothetical protein V4598_10065 [Bdellovibrionota bacterium]
MNILLLFISLQAFATDTKPEIFLKSCFQDYVSAFTKIGKDSLAPSAAIRKRCLSDKFNSEWDKMVSTEGTGADAFLLAQDYQESWLKNLKVNNLKSDSAEIVLGEKNEVHCLKAFYGLEKKALKIFKIVNCK